MIDRVRRLTQAGLELDTGQWLIFEFVKSWTLSRYSTKQLIDNKIYVQIERDELVSFIPELKSRTAVYGMSKLNSLATRGVLEIKTLLGRKWVAIGDVYEMIEGFEEIDVPIITKRPKQTHPIEERQHNFREALNEFARSNPKMYSIQFYKDFNDYWNIPMQKRPNVLLWESKDTWNLAGRLRTGLRIVGDDGKDKSMVIDRD